MKALHSTKRLKIFGHMGTEASNENVAQEDQKRMVQEMMLLISLSLKDLHIPSHEPF
jgi:hypothetical protein